MTAKSRPAFKVLEMMTLPQVVVVVRVAFVVAGILVGLG
jgi:hypothetical protein